MAPSDDTKRARSDGDRPRRRPAPSAQTRRARKAGSGATAPDARQGRERSSTPRRARTSSSAEPTRARRPRATATTREATVKRARRPSASGKPKPATKPRKPPIDGGPLTQEHQEAAPSQEGSSSKRPNLLARLRQWLRMTLRRLQRKLKTALGTPQARRLVTALLARRLPGPLRFLVEGVGDPDQRGFLFWWLTVTLIVTLAIALLLSIVLAPVTAILALAGVGIWMLIRDDRQPAAQRS